MNIIVGFGIAGAALALQLRKRGMNVLVYDEPYENQASRVAAGLFNPVTGKLMQKTWNADTLFPYLHDFYREAEELTGEKFFFPKKICIPFLSIEEQNNWTVNDHDFVEEVYSGGKFGEFINDKLGGVILKNSGFVDTEKYLNAVRKLFDVKHEKFNYDNHKGETIIFCEGVKVKSNPFFKWVPINPLKGETLTIKTEKELPYIFNRGVYVVPVGDRTYRAGSTYLRDASEGPTEAGRKTLIENLNALLKIPCSISTQSWGIRPTTPDRRPLVGTHPEHENLLIFNGMGTKGISLAPWSSGILSDFLAEGLQIKNDLNISRFYALYSKFRD